MNALRESKKRRRATPPPLVQLSLPWSDSTPASSTPSEPWTAWDLGWKALKRLQSKIAKDLENGSATLSVQWLAKSLQVAAEQQPTPLLWKAWEWAAQLGWELRSEEP